MRSRHRSAGALSSPPTRPLDVEQLRRFHAVARAGGFTAAARLLRVAQPAVSRSIAALEEDLGQKLIERTSRRFALTKLGERLATECEALFERVDGLRKLAEGEEVDVRGALRIGATDPIASALLPRAVASLLPRHPRLHPYVVVAPTSELAARLASGELDLVLTFNKTKAAGLVEKPLATMKFALVVAPTHASDPRTCTTFIGSREVEDARDASFPTLEKLRAKWPAARIRVSTNSITAHAELVRAGVGLSVLPEFLVHRDLVEGRLTRLTSIAGELAFPLLALLRKNDTSNKPAIFLAALRDALAYAPGVVRHGA